MCSRPSTSWSSTLATARTAAAAKRRASTIWATTSPHMLAELEAARGRRSRRGSSREELRALLPPGGARNAVDCALWELEAAQRRASRSGNSPGSTAPQAAASPPSRSAPTIPQSMARGARRYAQARAIKLKLTGELDLDIARVRAVRAARARRLARRRRQPGLRHRRASMRWCAALVAASVSLLEQPLARGREADLDGLPLADSDRRRRKRADARRRRRRWSAASTSSTSSSTSAAA